MPVKIAPSKIHQILESAREQLPTEEVNEMMGLIYELETTGLAPWINTRLQELMLKIHWQLDVGESPEWAEALIACDAAFLGNELKAMCEEYGLSPMGHKKKLCEKLYRKRVPDVVDVMTPYLQKMEAEKILSRHDGEPALGSKQRARILWTRESSLERIEILKALTLEHEPYWAQPWAKLPVRYREAIAAYYDAP